MHCDDVTSGTPARRNRMATNGLAAALSALMLAVLAGCGSAPKAPPTVPEPAPGRPMPAQPAPTPTQPAPSTRPADKPAEQGGILPAPSRPRSADELRLQAAKRLVAANPGISYTGKPPELLLAIPVISVELNGDGSVKSISVLRRPSQARDTEEIARAAIMRAAPFGDVSALPKPWKFTETFLFNNDRKFKPMTLDQQR